MGESGLAAMLEPDLDGRLDEDFMDEIDNFAVDWCDDPNFFNTHQRPAPSLLVHGGCTPLLAWQFVNEEPGNDLDALPKDAFASLQMMSGIDQRSSSGNMNRACTHCRNSKVPDLNKQGVTAVLGRSNV